MWRWRGEHEQHEAEARRPRPHLGGLDGGVLGDDAGARARRVEQHAVEAHTHVPELARVHRRDHQRVHAETRRVRRHRLCALRHRVVREDHACTVHPIQCVRYKRYTAALEHSS